MTRLGKRILAALFLCLVSGGVAFAQPDTDLARGQELYISNGCVSCHGPTAEGIATFPALVGQSADGVRTQVRTPRGYMPAFAESRLNDADLDLIAGWIVSLAADSDSADAEPAETPIAAATPAPSAEQIASGRTLFLRRSCVGCHGTDGAGRPSIGPDVRGVERSLLFRQVRTPRDRMPAFAESSLSDSDLDLIGDYLSSLAMDSAPNDPAPSSGGISGVLTNTN
jgi:mono/diheme cytochrome c family protein